MALLKSNYFRSLKKNTGSILVAVITAMVVLGIVGLGAMLPQRLQTKLASSFREYSIARNAAINYAEGYGSLFHKVQDFTGDQTTLMQITTTGNTAAGLKLAPLATSPLDPTFNWGTNAGTSVTGARLMNTPNINVGTNISTAIDSISSEPQIVSEYIGCDGFTKKPVFAINVLSPGPNNTSSVFFRKIFMPEVRRGATPGINPATNNTLLTRVDGYVDGAFAQNFALNFYGEGVFYRDTTGVDFPNTQQCWTDTSQPVRAIAKCETNCMNEFRVAVLANATNCNWVYGEWTAFTNSTSGAHPYHAVDRAVQESRITVFTNPTRPGGDSAAVKKFHCWAVPF
ncbi:MAG: hypothetical protein ACKOAD_06055 [Gammaproteobacteria bacterium]